MAGEVIRKAGGREEELMLVYRKDCRELRREAKVCSLRVSYLSLLGAEEILEKIL